MSRVPRSTIFSAGPVGGPPLGTIAPAIPLTVTVEGHREAIEMFRRMSDQRGLKAAIRKGMSRGMQQMVYNIRRNIPVASSGFPHTTFNIKRRIGKRFNRDQITHMQTAKVGVNVGMPPEPNSVGPRGGKRRGPVQVPHAHLYMGGTDERFTGIQLQRRSKIVPTRSTKSGRMHVRLAPKVHVTGKQLLYRGRVEPKPYVRMGVAAAWPQLQHETREEVFRYLREHAKVQEQKLKSLPSTETFVIQFV